MIILGIDTSLRSSGYGVLSVEGSRMRALEAGRIRNDPKLPLSGCLRAIHARVAELIAAYAPDVLSIESVIYGKNAGTMLVLEDGGVRQRPRREDPDPAHGQDAPCA